MKKTQVEKESRVIVGAHGVAAEEDHLVLGSVIKVGVLSLVIFAVASFVAWRGQVNLEKAYQPDGPPPKPIAIGQYEIGIVNQRMFEHDTHAVEKISNQLTALQKGTGDQPGVANRMPIDQAMERVIADAAKPPPPPPPPAPEPAPAPGSPAPTPH